MSQKRGYDISHLINQDDALQRMYRLFREGLVTAATIPDLETEAEAVAHHLLGCANYNALLHVYESADVLRRDGEDEAMVDALTEMADMFLQVSTAAVLSFRGPIGAPCQEQP